jgi:N-acetylglutamate synthase-like GNAT family acetyltransferase
LHYLPILVTSQAVPNRHPSFLNRLGHFIKGPNPLHPAVWEGRLSPLTFRRIQAADVTECLEIYKLNEPGHFPEGVLNEYEKCVREQSSYFSVAERNGQIVATGGMSYFQKPHLAVLCFGLVRPDDQNTGIGAALLLARLALLKKSEPVHRVLIFAVTKSFGYYERFGFGFFGKWKDVHGQEHPMGSLLVSCAEAQKCRQLLADHGISVPHDEDQVPFHEHAKAPTSD